ncbi:MAG: hypothetical protein R3B70_03865 [Polyangiaceae bacterium]
MAFTLSYAKPAEFPAVLAALPADWLSFGGGLIQLQFASMVDSGRCLVARDEASFIAGVAGWDETTAFGAMYAKFGAVTLEYQLQGISYLLARELILIAKSRKYRAILGDFPSTSPMLRVALMIPGLKEAGYVDGLHGAGVRSAIIRLDATSYDTAIAYLDDKVALLGNP